MFIAIPHQRPPHFGHECVTGDRQCEADCAGCREMRDSHAVVGEWDTPEHELRQLALAYRGHQEHAVHALARGLGNAASKYKLAFAMESGEFDVVEDFEANDDAEANSYAERTCIEEYPDRVDDWYVLDADGNNINA